MPLPGRQRSYSHCWTKSCSVVPASPALAIGCWSSSMHSILVAADTFVISAKLPSFQNMYQSLCTKGNTFLSNIFLKLFCIFYDFLKKKYPIFLKSMTKIAPLPQPNFATWFWFLAIFHQPLVCLLWWKIVKTHSFVPGGLWKWCYFSRFQWFWPGTTKKALFWHIFSILAMKGPQMWQKSLITWKYDGKTPLEKKIGAVSFTGGWAILFKKKKIWTVPLILQFNIPFQNLKWLKNAKMHARTQ